jgi:hypothetical protein
MIDKAGLHGTGHGWESIAARNLQVWFDIVLHKHGLIITTTLMFIQSHDLWNSVSSRFFLCSSIILAYLKQQPQRTYKQWHIELKVQDKNFTGYMTVTFIITMTHHLWLRKIIPKNVDLFNVQESYLTSIIISWCKFCNYGVILKQFIKHKSHNFHHCLILFHLKLGIACLILIFLERQVIFIKLSLGTN